MTIERFTSYRFLLHINLSLVIIGCWLLTANCIHSQNKLKEKIYRYSNEIEKARDMQFFIIPKLQSIKRKDLKKLANDFLTKDDYVKTVLPVYKKLGLIKDEFTLKQIKSLMKKVFLEQITAFFAQNQNTIYFNTHNIVKPLPDFKFSEKIGLTPMESIFVHELIHALDYHNFLSKVNASGSYVDSNVARVINEGSAMFSLFLYAARKANKNPQRFIEEHLKYLPLHYESTGYKGFDRLPEIIRYDMTLPYSLGPRLFYKSYKKYDLQVFKNIFSRKFCSLSNLMRYIDNNHIFCSKNMSYNKKLFSEGFNEVKYIDNFSDINILSTLFLIDKYVNYKIIKYIKSHKVFEYGNDTVLLMLKLQNAKVSKKLYGIFCKRYVRVSGKYVDKRLYPLKSDWDLTGKISNVGEGYYLLRAGTNVVLFVSYNIMKEEVQNLWKKILNSLK